MLEDEVNDNIPDSDKGDSAAQLGEELESIIETTSSTPEVPAENNQTTTESESSNLAQNEEPPLTNDQKPEVSETNETQEILRQKATQLQVTCNKIAEEVTSLGVGDRRLISDLTETSRSLGSIRGRLDARDSVGQETLGFMIQSIARYTDEIVAAQARLNNAVRPLENGSPELARNLGNIVQASDVQRIQEASAHIQAMIDNYTQIALSTESVIEEVTNQLRVSINRAIDNLPYSSPARRSIEQIVEEQINGRIRRQSVKRQDININTKTHVAKIGALIGEMSTLKL